MKFKLPSLSLVILGVGLSLAPTPAAAVQFRLLAWTSADVNLQFSDGSQSVETTVLTDDLSRVYEYTGKTLEFYKMVEHEGKPVKQVACVVQIPPSLKKGILVLSPGNDSQAISRKVLPNSFGFTSPNAPLVYNYQWLDDSEDARPPGTIEFRNASRLPVALKIEGHQLVLAPHAKAQAPLATGAKRMAFRAAAQVEGQWQVFASNPLPTRGPTRMMVILRDGPPAIQSSLSPGEPNITMISLFDWPAPPPAPAQPPSLASLR